MHINKITPHNTQLFNKQFNKFSQQAIGSINDKNYFVSQLKLYEKQSKQLGLWKSFRDDLCSFAEELYKSGKLDFANIIFSYLIKIQDSPVKLKEKCINFAIDISILKEDVIHLLARYVDLGNLYKQTNKSKKLQLNCLSNQEKLLTQIITKPQEVFIKYNTISKDANSLDTYKLRLAMTKVDIAKFILRTNPQKAKMYLESAKDIFRKFNRKKEENFVNILLSEITK